MRDTGQTYEAPVVVDLGDTVELTAASEFTRPEDGGNKLVVQHAAPVSP